MSKLPIFVILAAVLGTPVLAAQPMQPVSVAQLAQLLTRARGQKDKKIAGKLSALSLTERISAARLAQWETEFPGKHTHQALTELADASAFLDLPPSEVLHRPAPDLNAIQLMLNHSVAYVNKTIHSLPNFYARRTTTRYEDPAARFVDRQLLCNSARLGYFLCGPQARRIAADAELHNPRLKVQGSFHAVVTYVDGRELHNGQRSAAVARSNAGLVTTGEFGPILIVVLSDALKGELFWGHWEQDASGPLAVFQYSVPAATSHYVVNLPSTSGTKAIRPAYHGEISIDPVTGAIHRITAIADHYLKHEHMETSMMVRYSSVVIGGKPYICPVKGVALSRLPLFFSASKKHSRQPVFVTRLNDTTFTGYHLFRTEMKILPGNGSNAPTATLPLPSSH